MAQSVFDDIGGDKVICKGCIYYKTDKCVKWHYWQNVSVIYAKHLSGNGCENKRIRGKEMKTHLIGSAPTKEKLAEMIAEYYFWKEPADLHESNDGIYTVHYPNSSARAGSQIENVIVKNKKGRYRFERVIV